MTLDQARATATRRLVIDGVRILRPGVDEFSPDGIDRGAPTTVWEGTGSLGRVAGQTASSNGGDARMIATRTLRVPADATGVRVGDIVSIPGWPDHTVTRLDDRPAVVRVLQHLEVRESIDAPGVPS